MSERHMTQTIDGNKRKTDGTDKLNRYTDRREERLNTDREKTDSKEVSKNKRKTINKI